MSFSQRKGLKPTKLPLQVDRVSQELRNALWDCLNVFYFSEVGLNSMRWPDYSAAAQYPLILNMWTRYFKHTLDRLPGKWIDLHKRIRDYFFECEWNEVYDYIEFILNSGSWQTDNGFINCCNSALEREFSAYRLVGTRFAQIADELEIKEIEQGLASPWDSVREHLSRALELASDRRSPDYRNSIKESISAVESLSVLLSGRKGAKLADAMKELEKKTRIHGALRQAFESLYGYTSDEEGIRHALLSESKLELEDAMFMLSACSAFVNYVTAKMSK